MFLINGQLLLLERDVVIIVVTGPDGAVAMSSSNGLVGYWVRISVPAPTQSGILKAQWVGIRPLHPLLSH